MSAVMILLVIALILWFLAAVQGYVFPPNSPAGPIQLGWLGLFFYGLSILVK